MRNDGTPILEKRQAEELVRDLLARVPAFVPGWRPTSGGPSFALIEIVGRYLRALANRVNDAPDKNKLAFLDHLGVNLLPAQAARAPVVFEPLPGGGNARAPAGTRLGADVPGRTDPLVFETERAVAVAAARIAEVVSLWPARDAHANHSRAAIGGKPFTLFDGLERVPHELYLAHDVHLALAGHSTVEVEFELSELGGRQLDIAWEYWNGAAWRGFETPGDQAEAGQSFDTTLGLTRSGTVCLEIECAEGAETTVGGVDAFWVRGRLSGPLLQEAGVAMPEVDRIYLRSVIDRSLPTDCASGLAPDEAFTDGLAVDFSKTAYPLGRQPGPETAFYVSLEEAFAKPGAEVEICFKRFKTPEEEADELGGGYEIDVNEARKFVLNAARSAGEAAREAAEGVLNVSPNLVDSNRIALQARVDALKSALANLRDMAGIAPVADATASVAAAIQATPVDLVIVNRETFDAGATFLKISDAISAANRAAAVAFSMYTIGLVPPLTPQLVLAPARAVLAAGESVLAIGSEALAPTLRPAIDELRRLLSPGSTASLTEVVAAADAVRSRAAPVIATLPFRSQPVPDEAETRRRIGLVRDGSARATTALGELLEALDELGLVGATAAGGVPPPKLLPPRLVWEYWDGGDWRSLIGPNSDPATNLLASGLLSFVAPSDWEPTTVNDVTARWLRVRLASGSYGRLRLVSWFDQQANAVNFFPVIESRPPALEAFFLGYVFRSPRTPPDHCMTYNDFQLADRSDAARLRGVTFRPFAPVEDETPTLYLGFDAPLPADLIGLYLDLAETDGEVEGPPLEWEYWNGVGWLALTVDDETRNLAVPGMVFAVWPGIPASPPALVVEATGTSVQLLDARESARFAPGDLLQLAENGASELVTVASIEGPGLELTVPLGREYGRATIGLAELPRFGTPRTWIRARLRADGEPRRARVTGIYRNATTAAQIETVENELLGSGTAQPGQAVFFSRTPVLAGETVEVRELDGARAGVEYPVLLQRLEQEGVAAADVRTVTDPRSGQIVEVWVPWRQQEQLFFSGPADRHYTLERSRGRMAFGGAYGRVAPAGADNIRARRYRSGGGSAGNVPAGAISEVLSGVIVQEVASVRDAEGGADGEAEGAVLCRGPLVLRHRRQALSLGDYEALAREASPAVAVARALPATDPRGRRVPGWVRVIVIPESPDPRPQPSFELRRQVRRFLLVRTPASIAGRIAVAGPTYLPIAVDAVVALLDPEDAGVVVREAIDTVNRFFHPLTGGPDAAGWPFGRDVFLSDVAAVLEGLAGVDYVETLSLLLRGTPRGERIEVPPDRIVAAGASRVALSGGEV